MKQQLSLFEFFDTVGTPEDTKPVKEKKEKKAPKKKTSTLSKVPQLLTAEQQGILDEVVAGHDILVEAVIGSGKTTLLESVYNTLANKKVLYLTYNRLLKEEAQSRLKKRSGSTIQNYHGFTYPYSLRAGIRSSISQGLQAYCQGHAQGKFKVDYFDILLIDEYQDIDEDMARVLNTVKKDNPHIQVVAVGDINQKIYDNTTLDAVNFIRKFQPGLKVRQLSTCFRINSEHADYLGRIWNTHINGVNESCEVEIISKEDALEKLKDLLPKQVLVLGPRASAERAWLQTELEKEAADVFNKTTLYSDLSENEDRACKDTNKAAVFCTFDKCKGMERDYVFVVGFDESYWSMRSNAGARYEILRNVFSVAASRGKKGIYFINDQWNILDVMEKALLTPYDQQKKLRINISGISDFRKKELIDRVLKEIGSKVVQEAEDKLEVVENDHFIELLPVIGHWLEVDYFTGFNKHTQYMSAPANKVKDEVDRQLADYLDKLAEMAGLNKAFVALNALEKNKVFNLMPTEKFTLAVAAAFTQQLRYLTQVDVEMISEDVKYKIHQRMASKFPRDHQDIQVQVGYEFKGFARKYELVGIMDALLDEIPYEFKFSGVLSEAAYIQLATYLLASGREFGNLWNVRTNELVRVWLPDRARYINALYNMLDG